MCLRRLWSLFIELCYCKYDERRGFDLLSTRRRADVNESSYWHNHLRLSRSCPVPLVPNYGGEATLIQRCA